MGYRVEVFDAALRRIGEIDEWISLDFTVRLGQEGSWQLLVKAGTPQAELIQKGRGIAIWQEGVAKPVLSGQVDQIQKYWTKVQHTGPGSQYIYGKCHNTLAYRRLAFPDPARTVANQHRALLPARGWHSSAGGAIYAELNKSLGTGALPDRRMPGVNLTPSSLGGRISDTLRFDVIGTKLEEWYANQGVSYRFVYNADSQNIDLDIFKPRDLSSLVRFSPELGNLREYIWTLSAPKITRAIVACDGEGLDRYYYQKIDTEVEEEWGLQIEQLIDRRDIPIKVNRRTGEIIKAVDDMTAEDFEAAKQAAVEAANTALSEGQRSGNFQIYPLDTAECAFGRDYFVGDIVTVAVDGTEYSDVVREVVINVDDGGNATNVAPKLGQQGTGEPLNLYKTVYEMQRKLQRLQARM
ncbi:siphovirus ReqiPepy6 Gp37-like family protein [Streptomyces sp. NPDC087850]|uniref:siphovirus ReqiPepy6 Gp37-like family protein n=1 Tax=Streptomyces sp. NPDC087850 TaxID=3365809 RepID=UPI0037FB3FD8